MIIQVKITQRKLEIYSLLVNLGFKEYKLKNKNKIMVLDQYDIDHPLYFSKYSPLASLRGDIQLQDISQIIEFISQRLRKK